MGQSRSLSSSVVSMLIVTLIMVMVNESYSAGREFTDRYMRKPNRIDYADALTKSILFFEGQRSGKLPGNQRMTWRKDSALNDGSLVGVFNFANTYQGNYKDSLPNVVCPFYCDFSGFQDELAWGALWLYKATHQPGYLDFLNTNIQKLESTNYVSYAEFGWDNKEAGINILTTVELLSKRSSLSQHLSNDGKEYRFNADRFVCSILPEIPTSVQYSKGGLIHKPSGSNMQNAAAISFITLVYARHLASVRQAVQCSDGTTVTPQRMVAIAKSQVDYILGNNPLGMSYMVGYGNKFPTRIHHRASSVPSLDQHPQQMHCHDGTPYFQTSNPNPNLLIGAVVGGPDIMDQFANSRQDFSESEPTTYINAPLTGAFAYFARSSYKHV
ncbi:hypothetical protein MKX01_008173 [Papaver californicum]|nr:hypothetical protein MKX01_008173 [Papaver californicum]